MDQTRSFVKKNTSFMAVRSRIFEDERCREEMGAMLHERAASNHGLQEKYEKRKLAAVNYSKYTTISNGRMSKYALNVHCK